MTTYHEINDSTRVALNQRISTRIASFQQKEGEKWLTKCMRTYGMDIRINAVADIIRVAKQRGYSDGSLNVASV